MAESLDPKTDLANRVAYVMHMTGCSTEVATEAICEGDRELAEWCGYLPASPEARVARDQPALAQRQNAKLAELAAAGRPPLDACQKSRVLSDVARDMQNENPNWRPYVGASAAVRSAADFAQHGARQGHPAYDNFCLARALKASATQTAKPAP